MKINYNRLAVAKKPLLLVCFFACMFVFASFTKEDRQKVRQFKKEWMSKLMHKSVDLPDNTVSEGETVAKNEKTSLPKDNQDSDTTFTVPEKKNIISLELGDNDKTPDNSNYYPSKEKEGTIGTFSDKEQDRISDNFFTIDVPVVNKNTVAYLEYDLFGLASHQSVSRSINHNIAIGGEIVVPNAAWSHQKEEISTTLIKNGVNTILFTSPADGIRYKIKNLRLVFGKEGKQDNGLIVSSTLSGNTLYIKGNNIQAKNLNINNENVSVQNGEFEKIIELSEEDKLKGHFSVTASGISNTYKIPGASNSFKVSNNNYSGSKVLEISNDKEFDVKYEDLGIKVEKETSESALVEVLKLRAKDFPVTSQGIKNVTANNAAYRISFTSGKLNKNVKLTIPYDEKRLGLVSPKDIKVFFFDYASRQWKIEPSAVVDQTSKTVTFENKGDNNDYINGIISVPESPQTTAFAPTSISGLKAGDPAAKMQFMSPPTANQRGDASMSYPIEIPSGRNGMQPNLAVSYSSSRGNGLMGEGWDISGVSTITLDTRWGTPTFDYGTESEIYLLDGEMLMYEGDYLPHRHNTYNPNSTFDTTRQARNTSGKKNFYLRKGNNFLKIERYGVSPTNYRWVITTTDGTKKYYGGNENAINDNAVVKTNKGQIVQWGIIKEEDVYSNNIKYYYDNMVFTPGVSPALGDNENLGGGRDFHIKQITYTGQYDSDGPYIINFSRKMINRPDYSISAKEGVKRVEVHLLDGISVLHKDYLNSTIRYYAFDYTTGQFYKSLLRGIETNGIKYQLEYYNDTGGSTVFGPDKNVNVPGTDAFSGAVSAATTPSKISADNNFEWGWSLRIGAGLGLFRPHKTGDKNFMISGFTGESYPDNKRAQELIDFNGDGVADILYRKRNGDNGIKLIPGSLDGSGNLIFGGQKDVLNLKSNFTRSEGSTWTTGATVLFNWWKMGFDFTKSWSQSESKTPVYLIDANSDGLPDVVNNEKVWFNRINSNGQPEIVTTSDLTENMVITGNSPVPYTEPQDPADTEEPVKAKNDVVKVWIAPKSGYIRISDHIAIYGTQDPAAKAVYSIETKNPDNLPKNCRLFLTTLAGGSPDQAIEIKRYNDYPGTPLGINNSSAIYVKSGDKVYFRLHKKTGINYIVKTNPTIQYLDSHGMEIHDTPEEEQNDFMPNSTNYEDKFILNNLSKTLKFDYMGSGHIDIPGFTVPKLNDEVTFSITLSKADINDPAADVHVLYTKTYPESNTQVDIDPVDLNFFVPPATPGGWHLKFTVESDSYMSKEFEWRNIHVAQGGFTNVHDVAQYPSYYVKDFKKKFDLSGLVGLPQGSNDYSISINKNFSFTPNLAGNFLYVIRIKDKILAKRRVVIQNGTLSEYDINGSLINGTSPVQFYTGDPAQTVPVEERPNIMVFCNTANDRAAYDAFKTQIQNNIFNIYYGPNHQLAMSTVETSMNTGEFNSVSAVYHNWGQFIYNESKDVKKGNNSLAPPSGPRDLIMQTGPSATNGPDYTLNPDTPKDQYGALINNDFLDAPFGQFNYDYSSCSGSSNSDQYGECVGDIIQANFQNSANNIMAAFSPIIPLNTHYKKESNGTFTERWVNNVFKEQYSAVSTFRDEESITPFFNNDDPDEQDIEIQGNINTKMYAIEKKQKSKAKTTNWGLGIPVISQSVSELRDYGNINTQDFFDVNGDGYPDMLYRTQAQLTNPLGGLKGGLGRNIENNGDSVISNNDSFQKSNTIAFSPSSVKTVGRNTSNTNSDAKADTSVSWSGGLSYTDYPDSYDKGLKYWIDINGDGLADRVEINGNTYKYKLNYGTGLVDNPFEFYKGLTTNESKPVGAASISIGGGLSGVIDTASTFSAGWGISGSVSASSSSGSSRQTFQDVNGDGLVDILSIADNGAVTVAYNMGNKFAPPQGLSKQGGNIDFSKEVRTYNGALSLGGGFYINIPLITLWGITILYFRAGADVSANIGVSVSEINKGMKDINGDGYPDLVVSTGDGLRVNYSRIGRTNKLAKVTERNTNGTFTIDYEFTKPSYNDPNAKLVMKEVKIFNPDVSSGTYTLSTPDKDIVTRFKYEKSRHDRRERTNYGFEKVITEEINAGNVYRRNIQTFYNSTYFNNGLLRTNETYVDSGYTLSSRSENTYKFYKYVNGNAQLEEIPFSQFETYDTGGTEGKRKATTLLAGTTNTAYENGGSITTQTAMKYNNRGQLTNYSYTGNIPTGNYSSEIAYHDISTLTAKNILNVPSVIKVYDNGQNLMRQRETEVDPGTGDITLVKVKLNASDIAETYINYDGYGNIYYITYPQGYSLTYDYDAMGKYVTKVTDSFGAYSSAIYDPRWDAILESTDISGNVMKYTYDSMGRLTSILAPKEAGVFPFTIKYTYFLSPMTVNNIPLNLLGATTENFDVEHPGNSIETITLSDFTGRAVQVKKDIELAGAEKMSVSGMTMYDALGRAIKQYHPTYENKDAVLNKKLKLTLAQYFTQSSYDALNRATATTDEDGNITDIEYGIEGYYMKKTISQMQNISTQMKSEILTNAQGKIVSTRSYIGGQPLQTHYDYNNVGELIRVEDPEGIVITYEHDLGGRRIYENHSDHGATRYAYDLEGRLVERVTANLENSGLPDNSIRYKYSGNRLVNIGYPTLPNGTPNPNNVQYEYGSSGNDTGKVIRKIDGTGITYYTYGNMGEVISEERKVMGYNIPNMTFLTTYEYDSWNRLRDLRYPDDERVHYRYDLGGNLKMIDSDQYGEYVKEIKYDEYEQRIKILYGNETYSTYTYSPSNRMLATHNLVKDNYATFLSNNYKYDFIGNILSIENTAIVTPTSIGGTYKFNYGYDELNRLTHSHGNMTTEIKGDPVPVNNTGNMSGNYETSISYRPGSGIDVKRQHHQVDGNTNPVNSYENHYEYFDKTHKVKRVTDAAGPIDEFEYDDNGNLVHHIAALDGEKFLFWDEEDNLKAYYHPEPGLFQYYAYDDKGERTIKYSLNEGAELYQNGSLINGNMVIGSYKVYPNSYVVAGSDHTYTKHYYAGTQRIASRLGDDPGLFTRMALSPRPKEKSEEKPADPSVDIKTYMEKAGIDVSKVEAEFAKAPSVLHGLYYLHGDHLGTASMVTDENGEASQFFLNLPFGETFTEQQLIGKYYNPYKFNAKELDGETGFYYYGARYYNPRLSIWYGVDPIAIYNPVMETEFYGDGQHNEGVYNLRNLNPYIYCYQNPIVLADPNGKQTLPSLLEDGLNWLHDTKIGRKIYRWGNSMDEETQKEILKKTPLRGFVTVGEFVTNLQRPYVMPVPGINKPCGCFTSGTQVLTEEGYKNIEDVKEGDFVWAYDDKTGDLKLKKVISTTVLEFSQIYKLHIDHEIIEATHEHPFFVGGKWLKVDELKVGDYVTLYDGSTKRIDKIEFISEGNFKVHNFEVEDYHSYFVGENKILVHNGTPCDYLPVQLPKDLKGATQLNKAVKDLAAGNYVEPRMDPRTGGMTQTRYDYSRDRSPDKTKKTKLLFDGALEYKVDVPGAEDNYRILYKAELNVTTGKWEEHVGYTFDHYETIHEFKKKK
ncbi:RHS repeat-associated protein [Chryseobacterium defluvii]|uniref:RHS repeat-associated protein n=1 Tax=Chryseobacterium defluvii TaxID=160396 RepID=A0A840KGA8_9FLAO|nr:polymorphic toxin-type HINT domain-containing protein [Chryseobacterium defluvii]MBB4807695.1 RHS repeat-associated protein [Chryseobacterium defluvii]